MTCFSIHKKFRIFLILLLLGGVLGGYGATAFAAKDKSKDKTVEKEEEEEEAPADDITTIDANGKRVKTKATSANALQELRRVEAPIVIELFTASDCTACVFADRMLYDAAQEKNVIALSCHITDLDALDKKNKVMGSPRPGPMDPCVFRQWTYSSMTNNADEIAMKVPVFYFNGDERVNADDLSYFSSTLNSFRYAPKNRTLEALVRWKDNDTLSILLPEGVKKRKRSVINSSVWLIRYKNMQVEKINAGVNKGRVLRFSNIIQKIEHVGKWHGDVRTIDIDVPAPQGGGEKGGYVVLVGEMLGEKIEVAGKVEDYPIAKSVAP